MSPLRLPCQESGSAYPYPRRRCPDSKPPQSTILSRQPAGDLSFWPDVLALSACEVAGAFLGGVLVWVVYLPHFKTIPEPPPEDERDDLLCTTGKG